MVNFQRETLHPFWEDALPLFQAHWHEVAHWPDVVLDPDLDFYEKAEAFGFLRTYVVRESPMGEDRGRLMGYAQYMVGPNAHHRGSFQAREDGLFVAPEFRQGNLGIRLIRFAEEQLAADGVDTVYQYEQTGHPAFGVLLQRRGYKRLEQVWGKRLKEQ